MKHIYIFLITLMIGLTGYAQTPTVYQTIAREASGESLEAQVWVASVIITRARERKLTYDEVCLQKFQFSCWNKGVKQAPRTTKKLKIAEKVWELALNDVKNVNLYCNSDCNPYWRKKVKFIKTIGKLDFFKE